MFDDSQSPGSDPETRQRNLSAGGDEPPVSRRSVLKMTGSTAALAAAGSTPVAGESYDTITVPSNSKETIYVGDGETYENVLIDMTASGASAQIITQGSNWTIRDVGFEGVHPGGHYLLTPGVESASGTGLIENVYLGDGQVEGTGSGGIWINANLPHRGTITFRNVHVAGMVDNGLYGSGVGAQGHCGNHHVEESYFYNNTISNNRTNASCRRCDVYDTVVHVDGDNPACGTGCSAPGSTNTRGFWSWYGETYLENVDVRVVGGSTFATADGGYFTTNDVRTGSDADVTPPDCVPTTAEDAADGLDCDGGGGGGGDDPSPDDEHLEVVSADGGPLFTYEFTVKGSVSLDTNNGDDSAENNDSITDNGDGTYTVTGEVGNGYGDAFYYDGNVLDWTADTDSANYDLYRNGDAVTASELVADVFEVVSVDGGPLFTYSFDVSDDVSLNTSNGDDSAENNDSITDDGDGTFSVSGEVGNGYGDSYYFDGDLSNWSADTDASNYRLYVDGSEIQPPDIGDGGETVLDDFEDGDVAEYSGHTSGYQVQSSTVLEGSSSLENTDTYGQLGHTSASTTRGNEYRCKVEAASGSAAEPSLLVGVQDESDPLRDCYWAFPDASSGTFELVRRDGDSSTILDSVSHTFQEATTYEVALEYGQDSVKAVLYDSSGDVAAETATVSDSTYSGGTFGFYTGGGSPAYYDHVTERSL